MHLADVTLDPAIPLSLLVWDRRPRRSKRGQGRLRYETETGVGAGPTLFPSMRRGRRKWPGVRLVLKRKIYEFSKDFEPPGSRGASAGIMLPQDLNAGSSGNRIDRIDGSWSDDPITFGLARNR